MSTVPAPAPGEGCTAGEVARAGAWTLVLPVKGGPGAKSRLLPPAGVDRWDLATAFALDVLAAAVACPAVRTALVVTADERVARAVAREAATGGDGARRRVRVVPETRPGSGLVAAVADGTAAASRRAPADPVAVLLPDLPALRAQDLCVALSAAGRVLDGGAAMAFLPDAEGTGTVLLTARSPGQLRSAFGPDSAAAHAALGARSLGVPLHVAARLRRDVDTARELELAIAEGTGPRTRAVLAAARSAV